MANAARASAEQDTTAPPDIDFAGASLAWRRNKRRQGKDWAYNLQLRDDVYVRTSPLFSFWVRGVVVGIAADSSFCDVLPAIEHEETCLPEADAVATVRVENHHDYLRCWSTTSIVEGPDGRYRERESSFAKGLPRRLLAEVGLALPLRRCPQHPPPRASHRPWLSLQ